MVIAPLRPHRRTVANRIQWFINLWRGIDWSTPDDCWPWRWSVDSNGYGQLFVPEHHRRFRTHQLTYRLWRGTVTDGLELDHLCRNSRCANPQHLEPVTHRVNILRGKSPAARAAHRTHCLKGHQLSADNLRLCDLPERRRCLMCDRARNRRSYYRHRARIAAARKLRRSMLK